MSKPRPFSDESVKAVFEAYPPAIGGTLRGLRGLIFEAAEEIGTCGALTETLKWGQPAYLPAKPRTGTTLRIDALKEPRCGVAMYVHCQTTLVDDFKQLYPDLFTFEGNRAMVFEDGAELPRDELKHCIALALTYHLNKARG